jgi:hypothetical protein
MEMSEVFKREKLFSAEEIMSGSSGAFGVKLHERFEDFGFSEGGGPAVGGA